MVGADTGTARPARQGRHTVKGIPRQRRGQWYVVERPDGRRSRRLFRSAYRAAEHVMRAAGVDWWPKLAQRGVRVVVDT